MQKAEKAALAAIEEEVRQHDFDVTFESRHRHPQFVLTAPCGWTRRFTVASSGRSDVTSQANFARQKARAVLREYEDWLGRGQAA